MIETPVFIAVVLIFMVREVIHVISFQQLTNKLMSRNYSDYVYSKESTKQSDTLKKTLKEGLKMEEDLKEDLSPIEAFIG